MTESKTTDYNKILQFNSHIVNCMADILSRTKEIVFAHRISNRLIDEEYKNKKILNINYHLVVRLSKGGSREMNAENTRIPLTLARKLAEG